MKPSQTERTRPAQELPVHHGDLDRHFIGTVVREFYQRVRADRRLGPIFEGVIGDDWEPHLEKLTDFWSAVMLKNGAYNGRPVPAHLKLKQVREADFDIWLGIFRQTTKDLCQPEIAAAFAERAERIAQSLKLAMFFRLPASGQPGPQ